MSESFKVLAQSSPSAGALTDLYTVPALTSASISSVVICNQNAAINIVFRIAIAVAGAVDNPKQYLYYDLPLGSNDTFIATIGVALAAGDVVRIRADQDSISFNLFGVEVV